MRKLSLFISLLTFVSNAQADPDDDVFTVLNRTTRNVCIKAAGEGTNEQNGLNTQWKIQSEIPIGQKRIFKRKELGEALLNEQIKLKRITNLRIFLDDSQKENEFVLNLSNSINRSFVITDVFLQHLGLIK